MKQRGVIQQKVYEALIRHGSWHNMGCGWVWDAPKHTAQLMEGLYKRGDATKEVVGHRITYRAVKP